MDRYTFPTRRSSDLDKRQVRLPVLNTIFPLFRRAQETEPGTTDTALFQQSTDNLFRGLMLRDPTVAAESKAPERRAYREVIAGSSVARRATAKFRNHAPELTQQLAVQVNKIGRAHV